ncbi:aminopeptidase N [Acuticoccus mangrovi]|uniref:Aminopeptidase N n=1 Tax=Acuticoccus mangrovi TaxID=2796142 RepID=A0A934IMR5_9HYPH|nr:aminopeptidase N [Acuticoccus mangrovi]MBJ3774750.1 aminopeptidase N [Acuticoccus mangrovi]
MRTDTGQTVHLEDYAPTPYRAPSTTLMIALHPTRTVVRNETAYEPAGNVDDPLVLEGDGLVLVEAQLDGMALSASAYEATPDRFVLKVPPKKRFTLTLVTIVSPDDNTELMGLYRSNGVYCTQCEAEGFRRITYAYDRPDVLTVYDVLVLADDTPGEPVLLSNGNLIASGKMGGRRYSHWHDPFPKPTYLFAVVAGVLGAVTDTFTTQSGKAVDLAIYVEPGKEARAEYAMDALKRSMRWDETRFGREYDLDVFNIVAVSDFNMGAMENKGLNVFNDRYVLADPRLATDTDYSGIEAVIAHEYFHNWTGNRITCRDWFQLCLKEGLTVFRDQEFSADMRSRAVERIEDVRRLRLAQFPEDAGPLRHPVRPAEYAEISNLYTTTVYEKGAELIRMLHTFIGETAFRRGMDTYFERFDGTAATVEDFISCFELDEPDAFMRWYHDAGTPTVRVDEAYVDGRYSLQLTQCPPEGGAIKPIPVRLAVLGQTGALDLSGAGVEEGSLCGDILTLKESATINIDGLNEEPIASVFRGFSAPVHIDRPVDPVRDMALLERDSDPFNLWDASQRLALGVLVDRYWGGSLEVDALAESIGRIAADPRMEPAFRAFVLQLPSRGTLVEVLAGDVDADKVDAAHQELTAALGAAMADTLAKLRARPAPTADDVRAAAAGERALRNAAQHLATAGGAREATVRQAMEATNMTDRLAALNALAAANAPEADAALKAFHDAFEDEPLVLNKWFSIEALRSDGRSVERVRELMAHPKFSLKNPNRVRSLIGAFTQNIAAFHRADGAGYRLLAEVATTLDQQNPQVAARLLTAFGEYRRFDAPRREAARAVLQDVQARARSSDVADIVRRLLKG